MSLPVESGIEDLIMLALKDLMVSACQTAVDTGDVSRAVLVKLGPRQASPEAVSIMIHENDPESPSAWPHRPLSFMQERSGGNLYLENERNRITSGRVLIGGGSLESAAFTLEFEVFGLYFPQIGRVVEREDVTKVAAVVVNRAFKAIMEAGPKIGTGAPIRDSYGKIVVDGPFLGDFWTDVEAGESVQVRKFMRIWYKVASKWSTNAW